MSAPSQGRTPLILPLQICMNKLFEDHYNLNLQTFSPVWKVCLTVHSAPPSVTVYGLYGSFSPSQPYMGTYPVFPYMYSRTSTTPITYSRHFCLSPFVCDTLFPTLPCKTKHNLLSWPSATYGLNICPVAFHLLQLRGPLLFNEAEPEIFGSSGCTRSRMYLMSGKR